MIRILEEYTENYFSEIKFGRENVCTAVCDVKGSYPAPPDAKQTPVANSSGWRLGSKYAGRNSFTPNSSADPCNTRTEENNHHQIFILIVG